MRPLEKIGECHFTLERGGIELQLEALVVSDLDVDILAGIPFMSTNDIVIFPSKQKNCYQRQYYSSVPRSENETVYL